MSLLLRHRFTWGVALRRIVVIDASREVAVRRMPSGLRYWTVLDDDLRVVVDADLFLRELRLARGRAELTTKAYAEGVVLYLRWCRVTGRDWRTAAEHLGLFVLWLRWTPGPNTGQRAVRPGPGSDPVRGNSRINKVLTAVRGFLAHGVGRKAVAAWVLEQLYAMFLKCGSAPDRLIVLLLSRVGLRPGQVAGLHRADCHLMQDSRAVGCDVEGAHLHVIRRQNVNKRCRPCWVRSAPSRRGHICTPGWSACGRLSSRCRRRGG